MCLLTLRASHIGYTFDFDTLLPGLFNENDHSSFIRGFGENLQRSPRNRMSVIMFETCRSLDALN